MRQSRIPADARSANDGRTQWTCCQLGAREHYAIPRALRRIGLLGRLLTDAWADPRAALPSARWKDRYHADLRDAGVVSWNNATFWFELKHRLGRRGGWPLIVKRNEWFQTELLAWLNRAPTQGEPLFSYSYTADRIFNFAKRQGRQLILGQIDPGPVEERLVAALHQNSQQPRDSWRAAPESYWDRWRRECELADQILVNSDWSRQALLQEGVPKEKLHVVPLAFEPPSDAASHRKEYPPSFSRIRPLRILFLGQANLRKGMGVLLEVMQNMANAPVEFWIVGPVTVTVPDALRRQPNIHWEGAVPRSSAREYYRRADVFIFPTHSDGFGLTQLEAQAWKVPIIASPFCGDVVTENVNGMLLPAVTTDAIYAAVHRCREHPDLLAAMSERSGVESRFSMASLSHRLSAVTVGTHA